MTRIADSITIESIISTSSGENIGNNANSLIFPMLVSCKNLIQLKYL